MEGIIWQGFPKFAETLFKQINPSYKLGIIYMDVIKFSNLQRVFGEEVGRVVLLQVMHDLKEIANRFNHLNLYQAFPHYVWEDSFVVVIAYPEKLVDVNLNHISSTLVQALETEMNARQPSMIGSRKIEFHFGSEIVEWNQSASKQEKVTELFQVIERASNLAKQSGEMVSTNELMEYETIIQTRNIHTLFQPIVNLEQGDIFGYEALSRGPRSSVLSNPEHLLRIAERCGDLFAVEQILRETAIESFARHLKTYDTKRGNHLLPILSLNVHPLTIHDPKFISGKTMKLIHQYEIQPKQVLIEITEHQLIKDYSAFMTSINHYRNQGYQIAIDDAGAGYSGLQMILELAPDFIKLDMSMTRGIDRNPKKQIMVDTLVNLSKKLGALIIAEGIETFEELMEIQSLGVPYGQGFLFGKPDPVIKPLEFKFKRAL